MYESASDRSRERSVADAVFQPYGLEPVKLPVAYELDFAVMRGATMVGVAEVKVRDRAYGTLMLSLHKAQALRRFADEGLIAWLLVHVPAGIYVKRMLTGERLNIRLGGRADRGDWQDIEPVAHFPMLGMKRVAGACL